MSMSTALSRWGGSSQGRAGQGRHPVDMPMKPPYAWATIAAFDDVGSTCARLAREGRRPTYRTCLGVGQGSPKIREYKRAIMPHWDAKPQAMTNVRWK
jgi:hypothetical protein